VGGTPALSILTTILLLSACGDDDGGIADNVDAFVADAGCACDGREVDARTPGGDPLAGVGEPELVMEGFQFLEGPVWRPDGCTSLPARASTRFGFRFPATASSSARTGGSLTVVAARVSRRRS
jgi:hypothetical protein